MQPGARRRRWSRVSTARRSAGGMLVWRAGAAERRCPRGRGPTSDSEGSGLGSACARRRWSRRRAASPGWCAVCSRRATRHTARSCRSRGGRAPPSARRTAASGPLRRRAPLAVARAETAPRAPRPSRRHHGPRAATRAPPMHREPKVCPHVVEAIMAIPTPSGCRLAASAAEPPCSSTRSVCGVGDCAVAGRWRAPDLSPRNVLHARRDPVSARLRIRCQLRCGPSPRSIQFGWGRSESGPLDARQDADGASAGGTRRARSPGEREACRASLSSFRSWFATTFVSSSSAGWLARYIRVWTLALGRGRAQRHDDGHGARAPG